MKRIFIIGAAVAVLLLALCGCAAQESSSGSSAGAAASTSEGATASESTTTPEPAQDTQGEMTVKITAGEHVIYATLYDNASARLFYESLPVTYPMENLYSREMCYHLGEGTWPADEAEDQTYEVGDISYWPPKGSLVILYDQNGEVFQRQPIGHTDDDVSFFSGMPTTDITFEKA